MAPITATELRTMERLTDRTESAARSAETVRRSRERLARYAARYGA